MQIEKERENEDIESISMLYAFGGGAQNRIFLNYLANAKQSQ